MKRFFQVAMVLVTASTVSLCWAQSSLAQDAAGDYEVIEIPPQLVGETTDVKRLKNTYDFTAREALAGRKSLTDPKVKQEFDGWISRFKIAEMTQLDKLGELAALRADFNRRYLQAAVAPDARAQLLRLTFEGCSAILAGNFHPAVKYNAMLLVGELNTREMQQAFQSSPPLPLKPARDLMIAELKKPEQASMIKVAILIGLLRHAEAERADEAVDQIPADVEAEITQLMLDIVNAKTLQDDISEDGQAWLRGRAIEVLAALGNIGQDASVFNAIVAVIDDADARLSLKCVAARALGRLKYSKGAVDAVAAAQKVSSLASQETLNQLARAEDQKKLAEEKKLRGGPAMGSGYESYDSSMDPSYAGDVSEMMSAYSSAYGAGAAGAGPTAVVSKLTPLEKELASVLRRRGKFIAYSVRTGLTGTHDKPRKSRPGEARTFAGLHAAAKDQAEIDAIDKLIEAVTGIDLELEFPDGDKIPDPVDWDTFAKGIRTKTDTLAQLLPQAAQSELPDAPELPSLPPSPGSTPAAPGSAPAPAVSAPSELPTAPEALSAPPSLPEAPGGTQ